MASQIDNEGASTEGRARASRGWMAGKYAISLLLLGYLAVSVEWPKVWAAARTVSVPWLLTSLLSIPASIVIISVRYRDLIGRLISFRAMVHLVIFQGAISTFLANVAGSLSYIGILIKVYKVSAELAVQSTIIARLIDMLASVIVAALLVALAWDRLRQIQSLVLLAMVLAVIVLCSAIVVIAVARRVRLAAADEAVARGTASSFLKKTFDFGMRVVHLNPGYVVSIFPRTLAYSFAMQAVIAIAMYCNARAFNMDIGFFEAALVGVVSSFIASVPVTVFGGLGVYEVSTVGLLAVFGVPIETGAAMILVVRTIFFVAMAVAFFVVPPPTQ